MSAPKTDLDTQEKRHRGPLAGMAAMAVFGVVLILALVVYVFVMGNEPREPAQQVDDRTGAVEENPAAD